MSSVIFASKDSMQKCQLILIVTIGKKYSLHFSYSDTSDSLWPQVLQRSRLPCWSPTPGAYSISCPSSRLCHPTISSSDIPFSSWLQCCPASGSFLMSQLFAADGQSIGASASASVLPMNTQDWFLWDWLVWSPCSPRDSEETSSIAPFKSINSSVLFIKLSL